MMNSVVATKLQRNAGLEKVWMPFPYEMVSAEEVSSTHSILTSTPTSVTLNPNPNISVTPFVCNLKLGKIVFKGRVRNKNYEMNSEQGQFDAMRHSVNT